MAIRYDASGDYLEYASGPTGACTLAGWFRYLGGTRRLATTLCLASNAPGSATGNSTICGMLDANGSIGGYVTSAVDLGFDVGIGDWFFSALTRNGDGGPSTVWRVYGSTLGGTLVESSALSDAGWNLQGNRIQIATNPYASTYNEGLDGASGPVWVFDSVLSATQLDALRRRNRPQRNAWLWLPSVQAGAARTTDWSGNARTPTVGGTLADTDGPPIAWGANFGLSLTIPEPPVDPGDWPILAGTVTMSADQPQLSGPPPVLRRSKKRRQ